MEELWRRCQEEQEGEGGDNLNHELMGDGRPHSLIEQPPADKEETGQAEEEENGVEPHRRIAIAEMQDMRIDDENHRESSHRIDIGYTLRFHLALQKYRKKMEFLANSTENVTFAEK